MSNAAEQFKQDFPEELRFSVNHYREYGSYMKSDEDDIVILTWTREGIYDYRGEYIPTRYGGGIYVEMYNRVGVLIDRNMNGDPLPLPE